jgi:ubiquinone/menaquinone biosynthesis C-methylase UbiE
MELDRLRERYRGERARNYDRDRVSSAEWQREQAVVESFLRDSELKPGDVVLDVPVGTGRFLDLYKSLGCRVIGLDISDEMLEQAVARGAELGLDAELRIGDITRIEAGDSTAKAVVCVRILNLLGFSDFQLAIGEAARVSGAYVIAGIQVRPTTVQEGGWWRRIASRRHVRNPAEKEDRSTAPHPEASVLREFRKRQLTVVRQELIVDTKSAIYYLYLLRKSNR